MAPPPDLLLSVGERGQGVGRQANDSRIINWQGVKGLMAAVASPSQSGTLTEIPLELIDPSPYQARQEFDEQSIAALADSLKEHGVLQPVVVRAVRDRYQLIMGERRRRAAKMAGMEAISALVREGVGDQDAAVLGLVENLQRKDLSPADVCRGLRTLKEMASLTWEEVGGLVGLSRPTVFRYLGFGEMPEAIQDEVRGGNLSMAQAKALSSAPAEHREELLEQTLDRGLSAPQVKKLSRLMLARGEVSPDLLAREVQSGTARRKRADVGRQKAACGEVTEAHRKLLVPLEDEEIRHGVEENIVAYNLDLIDTRRIVMLLLESEDTPVPSAVAIVRQLRGRKLGEVLTRIEVALEIMNRTSFSELTGSERKMTEVILKWLTGWIVSLQGQLRQSWLSGA